jgi:hypothetical protein
MMKIAGISKVFQRVVHRSESDFEALVIDYLKCLQPRYYCVTWKPSLNCRDGRVRKPDAVFVRDDFKHWALVEVELARHSFDGHVYPQVADLAYADVNREVLADLRTSQANFRCADAERMFETIPPDLLVIADQREVLTGGWLPLRQLPGVQLAAMEFFRNDDDGEYLSQWLGDDLLPSATETWECRLNSFGLTLEGPTDSGIGTPSRVSVQFRGLDIPMTYSEPIVSGKRLRLLRLDVQSDLPDEGVHYFLDRLRDKSLRLRKSPS